MGSIFCCRHFHLGHPQRVTQPQEWLIKHSILPPRSSSVVRTTRAPAPTPPVVQIAECSSTDTPKERTVKSLEALRTPPKASPRPPSHFSGNKSRHSQDIHFYTSFYYKADIERLFIEPLSSWSSENPKFLPRSNYLQIDEKNFFSSSICARWHNSSLDEWRDMNDGAGTEAFPGALLIFIDGTSIPFQIPAHSWLRRKLWVNYKKHHAGRYFILCTQD